jgi:hypothetical protein
LKRRIAELERLVAQKSPAAPAAKVEIKTETVEVLVPFIPESVIRAIEEFQVASEKLRSDIEHAVVDVATSKPPVAPARRSPTVVREPTPRAAVTPAAHVRRDPTPVDRPIVPTGLKKAERSILSVLAQFSDGRSKRQLAMLSGYAIAGGFNNAIGSLRSLGYINKAGEPILILPDGLAAIAGNYEPLPSGRALFDFWLGKLNKAERLILSKLIESWPNPLSKEVLAEQTGYAIAGGFNNALGRLRTLQLITRGTEIYADETLAHEVHDG